MQSEGEKKYLSADSLAKWILGFTSIPPNLNTTFLKKAVIQKRWPCHGCKFKFLQWKHKWLFLPWRVNESQQISLYCSVSSYYHNRGYDTVPPNRKISSWSSVHRERQSVKWPIGLVNPPAPPCSGGGLHSSAGFLTSIVAGIDKTKTPFLFPSRSVTVSESLQPYHGTSEGNNHARPPQNLSPAPAGTDRSSHYRCTAGLDPGQTLVFMLWITFSLWEASLVFYTITLPSSLNY